MSFWLFSAFVFLLSSCSVENELSSLWGDGIQFNVEEVPLRPDSGVVATRATKLTSISSFKVYAYDASGNTVINGATYTKNSSGTWSSSAATSWPSGTVTFYAFSPADNSAVTFDASTKKLTYTAPTAQGSQQDVLYAYASSSRPANNTVPLTFNHANAAFSVSASLASGCTATVNVAGVKLVNVMPTNTLDISSGSASASGSSISTDVAIGSNTLTTTAQTISSAQLMLPPQSVTAWSGTSALANTYLAVSCKVQANDKYVVGSSTANGTVYVPMDKTLTKGQDNTVNLVFGNEGTNGRNYGRDENGNRIVVPDSKSKDNITSADLGKVITYEGNVYSTVAQATAAGEHAAGMIAYVSGTGKGTAIALSDYKGDSNLPDDPDTGTPFSDIYNASLYSDYKAAELNPQWYNPTLEEYVNFIKAFGGEANYTLDNYNNLEFARGTFNATNFREKLRNCGADDFSVTGDITTYLTSSDKLYQNYGTSASEEFEISLRATIDFSTSTISDDYENGYQGYYTDPDDSNSHYDLMRLCFGF